MFALAFLNEAIKILQKIINKKLEIKWNSNVSPLQGEPGEATSLVRSLHIPVNNKEIKRRKLFHI